MIRPVDAPARTETPLPRVRGTADWLPDEFAELSALQTLLLDRFARAGYDPIRTPALEFVELHERKSGAGIVGKLFQIDGDESRPVCLRPELTAGIVRAYADESHDLPTPWRVSHAGAAFRFESARRADRLREFQQIGVERLGDGGPRVDAELVGLASWALDEAGVRGATFRIGHVGLILEALGRSGLPPAARVALVEMLSEAAAEGRGVESLEKGLEHFSAWLDGASARDEIPPVVDRVDDAGVDRLFRTLVPVVTGRRSGHEIIHRLRRKWELGRDLGQIFDRVRAQIRDLSSLKGPAAEVVERLTKEHGGEAPRSSASLRELVAAVADHGIDPDRVEIDLGFGRGIGFYSRMIFEIKAPTPDGSVEVGGGGRYDGLARVLGGRGDDRGAGFAFGLERLRNVLRAQGRAVATATRTSVEVVAADPGAVGAATRLTTRLRSAGVRTLFVAEGGAPSGVGRVEVGSGPAGAETLTWVDPAGGARTAVSAETLLRQLAEPTGDRQP